MHKCSFRTSPSGFNVLYIFFTSCLGNKDLFYLLIFFLIKWHCLCFSDMFSSLEMQKIRQWKSHFLWKSLQLSGTTWVFNSLSTWFCCKMRGFTPISKENSLLFLISTLTFHDSGICTTFAVRQQILHQGGLCSAAAPIHPHPGGGVSLHAAQRKWKIHFLCMLKPGEEVWEELEMVQEGHSVSGESGWITAQAKQQHSLSSCFTGLGGGLDVQIGTSW